MAAKNDKIGFKLAGISTEQFAMFKENLQTDAPIELSIGIKFGKDDTEQTVGVFTRFQFEQSGKPLLIIECGCHFKIEPESWQQIYSAGKLTLPKAFATHLTAFTVGTTRGVLHAKVENSDFHNYFIPPVDITKQIAEDVVIDKAE